MHRPAKGGGGVSAMPGRRLQFLVLICSTRATLAPSRWGELNFQLNLYHAGFVHPSPSSSLDIPKTFPPLSGLQRLPKAHKPTPDITNFCKFPGVPPVGELLRHFCPGKNPSPSAVLSPIWFPLSSESLQGKPHKHPAVPHSDSH